MRLVAVAAALGAGATYLLNSGLREPPMLTPRMAGEAEGYRLVTGRGTPPEAQALSLDFVPAAQERRESVLRGLAEFRATWKVPGPRVGVTATDVEGDGAALAEQIEGWLTQHELLAASTDDAASGMAGIPGATVPAPPVAGLLLRCRAEDEAMARDLALALAPALAGEVNIVFDERVDANLLRVAIVGAPRFDERGIAYFPAT